jgi:two-component system, NtrC family, response regulator AtoC
MAKILVIDDEVSILETLDMFLSEKGHTVFKADTGAKGWRLYQQHYPEIAVIDIRLPDCSGFDLLGKIQAEAHFTKVIMITAFQDMETTIMAMKKGAFDYIHKPLDADIFEAVIQRALKMLQADRETPSVGVMPQAPNPQVIIGRSEQMRKIFKMIGILCQNRATVLIQGETGTGKELIARVIHKNSFFAEEPFVTLDCSAVVDTLMESELFGHEKGAFTGAVQRKPGKIELAGNGTLFLDEIGELSPNLQSKLLGYIQRREYTPVGGQHPLPSHCRIIAATNRDLFAMVGRDSFREDLFYRLRVVTIQVPPLKARLEDIEDLVNHFLQKINLELKTSVFKLQSGVMDRLMRHSWAGNVRELENVLVEAVVRSRGGIILGEEMDDILSMKQAIPTYGLDTYSLAHMERHHIQYTLDQLGWNRSEAARRLKISLPTLRAKIKKYGLTPPA